MKWAHVRLLSKTLALLTVVIPSATSANPQSSSASPSISSGVQDPQAITLLEQCRSVMGVPDKSISLLLRGSIVDTDHDAQPRVLTIKDFGEHRERWEEQYPKATRTKIVDRRQGWIGMGVGKKTPLAISETMLRVPEFMPAFACVIGAVRAAMDVQYAGTEERVGVQVDHIHISNLHSAPTTQEQVIDAALADLDIYLDSATHVVMAVKKNIFSSISYENHPSMEVQYGSYETIAGTQIPFSAKHILNGHQIEAVTITNAAEGGPFTDADFK